MPGLKTGSHHSDPEFRVAVCSALKQAVTDSGRPVAEIARLLGVSRQALYKYLKTLSTPKSEVIHKACSLLGMRVNYRGTWFTADQFALRSTPALPKAQQGVLPFAEISDNNLTVTVGKRTTKSIEVKVLIKT